MPEQPDGYPDERERRVEALRSLAQQNEPEALGPDHIPGNTPSSIPEQPPAAHHARKRLLVGAISALVLIAVTGGLIARAILVSSPMTRSQQTYATRVFNPKADNVSCPKDVSWSPDGKTVALLGYQQTCPSSFPGMYSYHPGIIALYDQTTGSVANTLHPDTLIAAALHLKPPTVATPNPYAGLGNKDTSQQVIDYAHLLWSPDGKQLAVTFSVTLATKDLGNGNFLSKSIQGVLLVTPSGGDSRVLSHTLAKNEYYSGLWNLATGTYIPLTALPAYANGERGWYVAPAFSQPALKYQWNSNGQLQPVTPLNATSAPASQSDAPIGQPDGGKEFSIWQPGYAALITRVDSGDPSHTPQSLKSPIETWLTSLASWSVDGNYLYAGSQGGDIVNWRIAMNGQPAPSHDTLVTAGLADAPLLLVRDAGMAAALKRYHDTSLNADAGFTLVNLAWSPDGKRLAVEAPVPHRSRPTQVSDFAVSIYDCASGKLLKTLTPKLQLANIATESGYGPSMFLRWSPDGKQLLLYNPVLSGAQIWGTRDLPH